MSTITKVICDIKDCTEEAEHKQKTVSVRFITEQTEGRSVVPYLSGEKLDFCKGHYQHYITSLLLIGSGAQGHNDYSFVDGNDDIDHTINVRQEPDLERAFDLFIEKWCGGYGPHLLDSDSNDGEYIRRKIRHHGL